MGRRLDTDDEADAFVQRQDGWKLAQAGIPAIMVGGSFSDMTLLNAFLAGPYHKPDRPARRPDRARRRGRGRRPDVALGRRLADPAVYQRPPAGAPRR